MLIVTECRVTAVRPVEQGMLAFCCKWQMGEETLDSHGRYEFIHNPMTTSSPKGARYPHGSLEVVWCYTQ